MFPEPVAAQEDPPVVTPAQIVIAVDQSGSLSEEDVVREREAAALIAQSEFSRESTVTVFGFGSDEGGVGPTDEVCPPTVVSGEVERQRLSDCVQRLARRPAGQGGDTDHAAAMEQALGYFTDREGPKVVFLLTDGVLDVGETLRYGAGRTLDQRNAAAEEQLDGHLADARAAGVQVWPLGFGDVDGPALDSFAGRGGAGACGPTAPRPRAIVVQSSADVIQAIVDAYGAARCAGVGPVRPDVIGAGETVEVPVDIPPIATDGAITVVKQDAAVGVQYRGPDGRPVPKLGAQDGSEFEVSGENGPVESLRIVDPTPGRWTVLISVPATVPPQEVTTVVTWQGAVQAVLTPERSSVGPGEPVTVSLSLRTRRGPVTDEAQLAGLSFTADLVSEGETVGVPLRDDGNQPDPTAGDGTFSGVASVPASARGSVTLRGAVEGIGISGDRPSTTLEITEGPPDVEAAATLPNVTDTVAPGGALTGRLTLTNNSGQQRRIRVVVDAEPGSPVSVPGDRAVYDLAAAGRTAVEVPLTWTGDAPEGVSRGVLRVVDDADPGTEYGRFPFSTRVAEPPPYLLIALVVAGLLLAAALVVLLAARRRAQDLDGVTVDVTSGGFTVPLPPAPPGTQVYRFTVRPTPHGAPQVQLADDTDTEPAYRLTRNGAGARIRPPGGRAVALPFDRPREVADGVVVVVRAAEPELVSEARRPADVDLDL